MPKKWTYNVIEKRRNSRQNSENEVNIVISHHKIVGKKISAGFANKLSKEF